MDSTLDNILQESFVKESQVITHDFCEGVWLPHDYLDVKDTIKNFKVRDDDVWICCIPKTGSTWASEMVWCIANDLDFQGAKKSLVDRFLNIEILHAARLLCMARRKGIPFENLSLEAMDRMPGPRFIKSHLAYHLLPKDLTENKTKAKIIYIYRNPKDACISSYYYYRSIGDAYCGTFENFCKLYLADRIVYTPFWEHVIEFWKRKDSENVLFLKYQDMKEDLPSIIRKTAAFLNKTLSDDQVDTLAKHLSFENMKSNPSVNMESEFELIKSSKLWDTYENSEKFMRKGETNQWKTEMSEEMIQKFNDWTSEKLSNYPVLKDELQ